MKKALLHLLFIKTLVICNIGFVFSQVTTYSTPGSGTFTVPCGVSSITVQCWGGGGSGASDFTNNSIGGAGGGGGAYCSKTISVVSGQTFSFTVGKGGLGSSTNQALRNGSNTTFSTLIARGGKQGIGTSPGVASGTFGTASGGTTNINGANGLPNNGVNGGAGGAGANGGAGGASALDNTNGNAGAQPGGGGSGAGDKDATILGHEIKWPSSQSSVFTIVSFKKGGNGGAGKIVISYSTPLTLLSNAGSDQTLSPCTISGNLLANTPTFGTGTWSCVNNCSGVTINSPSSSNSSFSGLSIPTPTTFRWTVSNAGCTSSSDDVIIAPIELPTANAGADQTLNPCITNGNLTAVSPSSGLGSWSCLTNCNGVIITNPNDSNSSFSGLTSSIPTTFRWTVSSAGCTSNFDDITISTSSDSNCITYCPEGTMNCASNDGLINVNFATINAFSNVCTNGIASSPIVTTGNSYTFTATSGAALGNHSLAVYCDWNANGSFADLGEFTLIANNNMTANSARSGAISVPVDAECGATIKMRVIYVYGTPIPSDTSACSDFTYGETEDYLLTISCCVPDCSNGIQDCNELGIDCGGPCGHPCPGVPSCYNGLLDQDETSIDCGGSICAPCEIPCTIFSNATSNPVIEEDGSTIIDASTTDQTITNCVEVSYSNRQTNWVHGVFINPNSTALALTSASGNLPEANISTLGITYRWKNQMSDFIGVTSGNTISQNGWFVTTSAIDDNPGDNLGWPVGPGNTFGPFCFSSIVSCNGLFGDIPAFLNFQVSSDSYSGSWTGVDCGKETSFGANSFQYTLRCPVMQLFELQSFDAFYEGQKILLKWSTLSENNNDYFTILKSKDGIRFEELEQVEGAPDGSSITKREYASFDSNPINPISYYKIRQTDFNGEQKESSVMAVMSPKLYDDMLIVPNPAKEFASLTFNSIQAELTKIKILDLSGKVIFEDEFESNIGLNKYTFETVNYTSGLYILELSTSNDLKKIKFISQK